MYTKYVEARMRNYLLAHKFDLHDFPLSSITLDNKLEVHSKHDQYTLYLLGFDYLEAGYFSSIYQIPKDILI